MKMEQQDSQKPDEIVKEWTDQGEVFRIVRGMRLRVGTSGEPVLFEMVQKKIDHSEEGGPVGWQTTHQEEVPNI